MNPIDNVTRLLRPGEASVPRLNALFGENGWQYVGWSHRAYGLPDSPLANPYTCAPTYRRGRIRVASRAEAIEAYRRWLWQHLCAQTPEVLAALRTIGPETVLLCWCAPRGCHAAVVVRAAAWLRDVASLFPVAPVR